MSSQKAAIVILSDPKAGSEESLGRVFNALAAAYDYKQKGDEVTILFHGTGTRWPGVLQNPEHPAHNLFEAVSDKVAGVSCGCADVFGSSEDVVKSGFDLITNNPIPGTSGLASLQSLSADGYSILTF
ncbi:MAG: DsrE family protein [Planctomycetota bacterium]|nr:DsrE family protein [Planctomycetota bacterium]